MRLVREIAPNMPRIEAQYVELVLRERFGGLTRDVGKRTRPRQTTHAW